MFHFEFGSHMRSSLKLTFIIMCVCSCGLYSEAGPAGLTGADSATQAKGGYSERCHGGSEPAEALCHHLLWCQWGWKVHQFGQGEIKGIDIVSLALIQKLFTQLSVPAEYSVRVVGR